MLQCKRGGWFSRGLQSVFLHGKYQHLTIFGLSCSCILYLFLHKCQVTFASNYWLVKLQIYLSTSLEENSQSISFFLEFSIFPQPGCCWNLVFSLCSKFMAKKAPRSIILKLNWSIKLSRHGYLHTEALQPYCSQNVGALGIMIKSYGHLISNTVAIKLFIKY